MNNKIIYIIFFAMLGLVVNGCTVDKVKLSYKHSIELDSVNCESKIGVFTFVDNRNEIPEAAYGTMVNMLTAEIPYAYLKNIETDITIKDYITDAFKAELSQLKFKLLEDDCCLSQISFNDLKSQIDKIDVKDADKIILGRIKYFRSTQAGFAGLAFQNSMPKPRTWADIEVIVIDAKSKAILWAGNGEAMEIIDTGFPKVEEIEGNIIKTLTASLSQIIKNENFLKALHSTL